MLWKPIRSTIKGQDASICKPRSVFRRHNTNCNGNLLLIRLRPNIRDLMPQSARGAHELCLSNIRTVGATSATPHWILQGKVQALASPVADASACWMRCRRKRGAGLRAELHKLSESGVETPPNHRGVFIMRQRIHNPPTRIDSSTIENSLQYRHDPVQGDIESPARGGDQPNPGISGVRSDHQPKPPSPRPGSPSSAIRTLVPAQTPSIGNRFVEAPDLRAGPRFPNAFRSHVTATWVMARMRARSHGTSPLSIPLNR